ncbi:MAG: hypothetical protein QM523_10440 [Candidatus Pacebacteria bacterium]|nr:hypothetical protein [Candidatus Paceibacterota bacterium]
MNKYDAKWNDPELDDFDYQMAREILPLANAIRSGQVNTVSLDEIDRKIGIGLNS